MNITKRFLALLLSVMLLLCVFPISIFAENEDDEVDSASIPVDAIIYNGHSYKVYTDSSIRWHR